ncbi:MAG: hypothetical protein M1834_004737 [Cirrosporium novae-zelandiae]|nr:MAG: hypothetical protein M1834_004737 [Cirrosporium novae-zelandiae]
MFSTQLVATQFDGLPLLKPVIAAGRKALVQHARDISKAGYSLAVEYDLGRILGSSRIHPELETHFRNFVKDSGYHSFSDRLTQQTGLILAWGAGITVHRSLQDPQLFRSLVQLSLLAYTHDLASLARGISQACENLVKNAADAEDREFSSEEDVEGMLRQAQAQTSAWEWHWLFQDVEDRLADAGIPSDVAARTLPLVLLQGALDCFPLLQSLPEDRRMEIVADEGYSTIVVWAHKVLGLNVTVKMADLVVRFGEGQEDVVFMIENYREHPPGICLLSSEGDTICELKRAKEDPVLEGDFRTAALGYGKYVLRILVGRDPELQTEIAYQCLVNSWRIVLECLPHCRRESGLLKPTGWSVPQILEVGCFFFDDLKLSQDEFFRRIKALPEPAKSEQNVPPPPAQASDDDSDGSDSDLDTGSDESEFGFDDSELDDDSVYEDAASTAPPPPPLEATSAHPPPPARPSSHPPSPPQMSTHPSIQRWLSFRSSYPAHPSSTSLLRELEILIDNLSVILLCLTSIPLAVLTSNPSVPLHLGTSDMDLTILTNRLSTPNASLLNLQTRFHILARLLKGPHLSQTHLSRASLVSSHGHSLYLSTLTLALTDPTTTNHTPLHPSTILLTTGIPTRKKVSKPYIIDGTSTTTAGGGIAHATLIARPGDPTFPLSLLTQNQNFPAGPPRLFVGEKGPSAFIARVEFLHRTLPGNGGRIEYISFGFRKMARMLAGVEILPTCIHTNNDAPMATLPDKVYAYRGYGFGLRKLDPNVYVACTAEDVTARWFAIEGTYTGSEKGREVLEEHGTPLVRGACCLECAIGVARERLEDGDGSMAQVIIL